VPLRNTPLILSIETATLEGSIALSLGEQLIAVVRGEKDASHSEYLLRQIDSILREAGKTLGEVDLFAAAVGPGSFTGLRIGLATVKSFAATLSRPCVGIPSLEAVAHAAHASAQIVAALPAGRGELFSQLFSGSSDSAPVSLEEPVHLPPARLLEKKRDLKSLVWAGDGARIYSQIIESFAEEHGIRCASEESSARQPSDWIIARPLDPLAQSVAWLAWRRYLLGHVSNTADLRAIYVRPSDAEIKTA